MVGKKRFALKRLASHAQRMGVDKDVGTSGLEVKKPKLVAKSKTLGADVLKKAREVQVRLTRLSSVQLAKRRSQTEERPLKKGVTRRIGLNSTAAVTAMKARKVTSGRRKKPSASLSKTKKGSRAKKTKPQSATAASIKKGRSRRRHKLTPRDNVTHYDLNPLFDPAIPMPYVSVKMQEKLPIRAAATQNVKELKTQIQDRRNIPSVFAAQSPDNHCVNTTAYALMHQDFTMFKLLHEEVKALPDKPQSPRVAVMPPLLKERSSGEFNFFHLGRHTRRIGATRGGKEGNAALLRDSNTPGNTFLRLDQFEKSLMFEKHSIKPAFIQSLVAAELSTDLSPRFERLVMSGNVDYAYHVAKTRGVADREQFNLLAIEVLRSPSEGYQPLTPFRAVSVKKKNFYASNIMPIHCACINPDPRYLAELVAVEPDFDEQTKRKWSCRHFAAACRSEGPLRFLLDTCKMNIGKFDVDAKRWTPLHVAAALGRADNVRVLLAHMGNADPSGGFLSAKTREGPDSLTPLHLAAQYDHLETVQVLCAFTGADPDVKTGPKANKVTPLMLAAQRGHLDVVEALVSAGAFPDQKDKLRRTPLIHAVVNGQAHVASYLLALGVNVDAADSSGNTVAHYGAAYGWYHCLKLLIDCGADLNEHNDWRLTPLAVAYLKGHLGLADMLLEQPGTDINCRDEQGLTLLALTCINAGDAMDAEILGQFKYLLEDKKADPKVPDALGNTPLHHLASIAPPRPRIGRNVDPAETEKAKREHNDVMIEVAKLLVRNGNGINEENDMGDTAVIRALSHGNFALGRYLLDAGAKVESLDEVPLEASELSTILHKIISRANFDDEVLDTLKTFRDANPDTFEKLLSCRDQAGMTPFLQVIADLLSVYEFVIKGPKNRYDNDMEEFTGKVHKRVEAILDFLIETSDLVLLHTKFKLEDDPPSYHRQISATRRRLLSEASDSGDRPGGFPIFTTSSPVTFNLGEQVRNTTAAGYQPRVSQGSLKEFSDFSQLLNGRNALHLAVAKGHEKWLTRLIYRKSIHGHLSEALTQQDIFGITPLLLAIKLGQGGCARILLDASSVSGPGFKTGSTAGASGSGTREAGPPGLGLDAIDYVWHVRGHAGYSPMEQSMIQAAIGAKLVDLAMHMILKGGSKNLVSAELELGGTSTTDSGVTGHLDLDYNDCNGLTALHYAAKAFSDANMDPVVGALIAGGANPVAQNDHGLTPLHVAVNSDTGSSDTNYRFFDRLLDCRASREGCENMLFTVDQWGKLPLHYVFIKAGKHRDESAFDPVALTQLLVAAMRSDSLKGHPLSRASKRQSGNQSGGQSSLRQMHLKDTFSNTPLHYACQRGALISCITLIRNGAPLDSRDREGNTPLARAIKHGHQSVVLHLLQADSPGTQNPQNEADTTESGGLGICGGKIWSRATAEIVENDFRWEPIRAPPPVDSSVSIPEAVVQKEWQGILFVILGIVEEFGGNPTSPAGPAMINVLGELVCAALKHNKYNLAQNILMRASDRQIGGLGDALDLLDSFVSNAPNKVDGVVESVGDMLFKHKLTVWRSNSVAIDLFLKAAMNLNFGLMEFLEKHLGALQMAKMISEGTGHNFVSALTIRGFAGDKDLWATECLPFVKKYLALKPNALNVLAAYPAILDFTTDRHVSTRGPPQKQQERRQRYHTPLIQAVHTCAHSRGEDLRNLLTLGADPNLEDEDGLHPLAHAIMKNAAVFAATVLDPRGNFEKSAELDDDRTILVNAPIGTVKRVASSGAKRKRRLFKVPPASGNTPDAGLKAKKVAATRQCGSQPLPKKTAQKATFFSFGGGADESQTRNPPRSTLRSTSTSLRSFSFGKGAETNVSTKGAPPGGVGGSVFGRLTNLSSALSLGAQPFSSVSIFGALPPLENNRGGNVGQSGLHNGDEEDAMEIDEQHELDAAPNFIPVNLDWVDRDGNTFAHYAVKPLSFGSYCNEKILKILSDAGCPMNVRNAAGFTPSDLAHQLKYTDFAEYLLKFSPEIRNVRVIDSDDRRANKSTEKRPKAKPTKSLSDPSPFLKAGTQSAKRMKSTSSETSEATAKLGAGGTTREVSSRAKSKANTTPVFAFDFEKDSGSFLEAHKSSSIVDSSDNQIAPTVKPHEHSGFEDIGVVVQDPEGHYYNAVMIKIDTRQNIRYGGGLFNYYRLQIIQRKRTELYLLFTHWGRIGDPQGQYQTTPFTTMADAVKEFEKVFKSKSRNKWEDYLAGNFEAQIGKYKVVEMGVRSDRKNLSELEDLSLESPHTPTRKLSKEMASFLADIADVKTMQAKTRCLFQEAHRSYATFGVPFGKLPAATVTEAKATLQALYECIKDKAKLRESHRQAPSKEKVDQINALSQKMSDLNVQLLTLLPFEGYARQKLPFLDQADGVAEMYRALRGLECMELAGRILLAAAWRRREMNPLSTFMKF